VITEQSVCNCEIAFMFEICILLLFIDIAASENLDGFFWRDG
jgi:hypothetical protein